MSRLCIDKDSIVTKSPEEILAEEAIKEKFDKTVSDAIENRFKGEDSEEMYAMFNPVQRQLLDNFFKGFSVEIYKELNNTVELQIDKKNEKTKSKIKKLTQELGIRSFNLDDWVYDGMTDAGKNAGLKCDLCPRPIRYGHYAANKKTHEVLRFGCNCAADFFNIDKGSLASMRTIQARTLKDIKIIAVIMENNWHKEYYKYMAGYTGEVFLDKGIQGLRDLTTYLVKWDKNEKLVIDDAGVCPIKFGDGTESQKSIEWIKNNIVSCLNADLDDEIYKSLSDREIKKVSTKGLDKGQMNTAGYVNYAIRFVDAGLPIPKSLCDKLNSIVRKATNNHHPDYIKYAQELLISHNLAKSSLLRTAFTEFIVSYLSEKMGIEKRDDELAFWGIRGQKTFYNTVLTWETMVTKLLAIKEIKSLVRKGLISEEEMNKLCLERGTYNYSKIIKYIDDCNTLFLSNKEVVKKPENLAENYSKYMLSGVDKKIGLEPNKSAKRYQILEFSADIIPYMVARHYATIQNSYKGLIADSIKHLQRFFFALSKMDTDEEIMKLLCSLSKGRDGIYNDAMSNMYYNFSNTDKDTVIRYLDNFNGNEELNKEMLKKYKKNLKAFKKDCLELSMALSEVHSNMKNVNGAKKPTEIYDDYEDLVVKQEKTNKDYFEEYCDMLIAKRANKGMQQYLKQKNLYDLVAFKAMEPYADMLKDIMGSFLQVEQDKQNNRLSDELNILGLKDILKRYLDSSDLNTFGNFVVYTRLLQKEAIMTDQGSFDQTSKKVLMDFYGLESALKEDIVKNGLNNVLSEDIKTMVSTDFSSVIEELYDSLKSLFLAIKGGKVSFETHYSLIGEQVPELQEWVKSKNYKSVDTYISMVERIHSCNIRVDRYSLSKSDCLDRIGYYKGIKESLDKLDSLLKPVIEEIKKAASEKWFELRVKLPMIDGLNEYIAERIKFFEVDVEAERKKGYGYSKSSTDSGIRRRAAFKKVRYQSSPEEVATFIDEIYTLDKSEWSKGVDELIAKCGDTDTISMTDAKKYVTPLRSECYNHNLIFNHFELTYHIMKDLERMDKLKLDKNELTALQTYLGTYNLMKSDMVRIWEILKKYNATEIDFDSELLDLPKPEIVNIEELLNSAEGKADSSGYTGVEKADMVIKHPDFETLEGFIQSIVRTVNKSKSCSQKQLIYVNKACEKLGVCKVDEVKVAESEESEDIKDLALKIVGHPDFKKLDDFTKKVVTTISGNGRCSDKQKKYLDKAKNQLGL